jgi:predicted acetylornithine/succinylornithine family transaminase
MEQSNTASVPRRSDAEILASAERYLMNTYRRPAIVFSRGRGCKLYDSQGRAYLDFLGGLAVNALGYSHPRIVGVIRREAARAIHISNLFHNPFQAPLAKKLVEWSGMDRVFFTNSGTEAVEGAVKLARAFARSQTPGPVSKTRILALENSFHGRTLGALSLTYPEKYRAPFEPLVPGVEFVRFNDVADLEEKFDSSVCAFIAEPIQGEGGIHAVSDAFWIRARALATKHHAALIADEIQCGLGRTGRYFAYQNFGGPEMFPDIVTIAKPLAAGLPLGAVLAREEFAAAFSPGMHGTTFGGGPLACATAVEFLRVVEEERLLEKIHDRGEEIRDGCRRLARRFDFIRDVRGEGLILGLELTVDARPFVEEALRQGLIINCTHERVLRFLPPFVIRSVHVKQFLRKLKTVLAKGLQKGQQV